MSGRAVFRYEVPVGAGWCVFELRGPIRHVASRAHGSVEFWAENDASRPSVSTRLIVVGTGQPWPPGSEWVGTTLAPEGLVWHLLRDQSHLNWGQS